MKKRDIYVASMPEVFMAVFPPPPDLLRRLQFFKACDVEDGAVHEPACESFLVQIEADLHCVALYKSGIVVGNVELPSVRDNNAEGFERFCFHALFNVFCCEHGLILSFLSGISSRFMFPFAHPPGVPACCAGFIVCSKNNRISPCCQMSPLLWTTNRTLPAMFRTAWLECVLLYFNLLRGSLILDLTDLTHF